MSKQIARRAWLKSAILTLVCAVGLSWSQQSAVAKQQVTAVNIVPTISNISLVNGQLVAAGSVNATVNGQVVSQVFSNVPVNLTIAEDQTGATGCPILDLELAPINLNLLGLIVETSPICLKLTAHEGALLGDLLCSVANLLNGGLSLEDILGGLGLVDATTNATITPGLTAPQATALLGGLTNLLNGALGQLFEGVLQSITELRGRKCAVLNLELGPVNLNLLGLEVILDDCEGGPVTVDITARRGQLLGNLLCGLLHGDLFGIGDTLNDILDVLENVR